jgi:hypothetical protein
MPVAVTIRHHERGEKGPRAERAFSTGCGVTYSVEAPRRRSSHFEQERIMAKLFFGGFFATLTFVAVVLAALFTIFTLVSYLSGPVGG